MAPLARTLATMHRSILVVASTVLLPTTIIGCRMLGAGGSAPTSAPTDTARLRLTQEQTDCCYMEGQVSFATIRDLWGRDVAHRAFEQMGDVFPVLDLELRPGRYRVETYQRPCSGNCGMLDAPTDRCSLSIDLKSGETWFLTTSFAPGRGCKTTRTETAPSPSVPDRFALREAYPSCGEDLSIWLPADADPRMLEGIGGNGIRACFVQANADGRTAEFSAYERTDDSEAEDYVVYRTNADRSVDVFRPDSGDSTNTRWSWMHCAGLTPTGADGFALEGCAEPVIE